MLRSLIREPLVKQEIRDIIRFLSYHIGYVPVTEPKVIFAKTAKQFAQLFEGYKVQPDSIDEINKETSAFYDHLTNTIVFKGFTYVDGVEIKKFIIPFSTAVHEFIHFFQYSTGTFGSYRTLYEGTNDILSFFLIADDYVLDYKAESVYAFNMVNEFTEGNFWETINWMKKFTTHSDKNDFVHRAIKNCTTFSKYNPPNLLKILDDGDLMKIENEDVRKVFTKYPLYRVKQLLTRNRQIVQF